MSAPSADTLPLLRKTFVMTLRDARFVPAYVKAHDEIWPELSAALKAGGAHRYSISLVAPTMLLAYVEIEDEARWAAIASTEVCQRWWRFMAPLMETEEDGIRPKAVEGKEVFFME